MHKQRLLAAFAAGLLLTSAFVATSNARTPARAFYIVVDVTGNGAEFECLSGCLWTHFTYHCNDAERGAASCRFQIDETGGGSI